MLHEPVGALRRTEIDAQQAARAIAGVGETGVERVVGVRGETRVDDLRTQRLEPLCTGKRALRMFADAQTEVRHAGGDLVGRTRVHRRSEQHQAAHMQIVQLVDEGAVRADAARDDIGGAVDELGEAVDDHIRAVQRGRDGDRREGVVDDEHGTALVRDLGERRQIRHAQRGVGHRLAVEHAGARRERAGHGLEVREVHERGRDARLARQIIVQQRPSAAVERLTGDDVITRIAGLKERPGDRRHAARGAVRARRRLERGEVAR